MTKPQNPLFVVVVGCGRLGSHLANRMSAAGHSVVVIDSDERAFASLSAEYSGFTVEGDAAELAVLRMAKVGQADVIIAATREDNLNLMVAQVARESFGVRRALARVLDPRREEVYRALQIDTVCPTTVAADIFADLLSAATTEGQDI